MRGRSRAAAILAFAVLGLAACAGPTPPPSGPSGPLPYAVLADAGAGGLLVVRLAPLVERGRLYSGFGWRRQPSGGGGAYHRGLDIAAPAGTPVRAAAAGQVVEAGWSGGFGRLVRIRHGARLETAYAHLSRFAPRLAVGREVDAGELIGHVGSSGRATGPHLHFELRRDGRALDPLQLPPAPPGG
jgi:murein DD-endopeptidase MepM/ murein hydrolase activator NlpD